VRFALGVWSFVWTSVLSFFFSHSLAGCFSFAYLFIRLYHRILVFWFVTSERGY
jgi:hypothetical protein